MNRTLIRTQQARASRQNLIRYLKAVLLFTYIRDRQRMIKLIVAMLWRRGRVWPFLTREACIYRAAWREWVAILKQFADKVESERLLELDRKEGERLAELMRFEGAQAARRAKGRTPSYLARQQRRHVRFESSGAMVILGGRYE